MFDSQRMAFLFFFYTLELNFSSFYCLLIILRKFIFHQKQQQQQHRTLKMLKDIKAFLSEIESVLYEI